MDSLECYPKQLARDIKLSQEYRQAAIKSCQDRARRGVTPAKLARSLGVSKVK